MKGASSCVRTTCPYCGVGCGVSVAKDGDKSVVVSGDKEHPANGGMLCLKGSSLAETLGMENRLLAPAINGKDVSWDQALDTIAERFKHCIETYGEESIAFYVSGQLLTEDYYVVNKLVKGYLGTANIDTNSRLCMASSVAGHKRAFGTDTVPGCYEDLELAELVVLVGSNLAWCHPVLSRRLAAVKENNTNPTVINIDPRRTATSELADVHLAIEPDSDVALFNGLLKFLIEKNTIDHEFVQNHTTGFENVAEAVQHVDISVVARASGLDENQLLRFYQVFSNSERVVTVYSQGVNQSVCGTDKVNAIINCHLLTGRIGKPGSGPFSITGQPNAMGGRETGGLANTLACHMDIDNAEHRQTVQQFWNSPRIADKPGLKAVELFEAIGAGKIKALWIMATNPADSMPSADAVRHAMQRCEFVVQSDVVLANDTAEFAHVRLPAQAWSEKDGTVTNSERCISRQRRFRTPAEHLRPDWWAVAQVACRLGFTEAFGYNSPAEIFTEYAALSGFENNGNRDFDISICANLSRQAYEDLTPFYWPARTEASAAPIRFFADGQFYTENRRARFLALNSPVAGEQRSANHLRLNTGRIRDHWHTMTRTGYCASLSGYIGEPFLEIHPQDAKAAAVESACLANVGNEYGECVLRVLVTDRVRAGSVFAPIHWSEQFASAARISVLAPPVTDAVSGQPALKHARVSVKPLCCDVYGFIVSNNAPDIDPINYFAHARSANGWRTEFALLNCEDSRSAVIEMIGRHDVELLEYQAGSQYRCLAFVESCLCFACFTDSSPVNVSRNWLSEALGQTFSDRSDRHKLLAGRGAALAPDYGVTICMCFGIGSKQIQQAVEEHGCSTVNAVGEKLGAGTNCGSCRAEISSIVNQLSVTAVSRNLSHGCGKGEQKILAH